MSKIVIPKNSASLEEVMGAMQIYYDYDNWLSNAEYIDIYKNKIGVIGDDTDSSAYTKKGEIGAYYGFIEWADINKKTSPRRITKRGRKFVEDYKAENMIAVHEDIMCSLEEVSFGRNNFACQSCDSDIEPPALFMRAMLDLGYLTNLEFAYLVCKMEHEAKNYTDTIREIKFSRDNNTSLSLPDEGNKYKDPKPMLILERWGVLKSEQVGTSKRTYIAKEFFEKYEHRLRNLKIYNIDKNISAIDNTKSTIVKSHKGEIGRSILYYGVPGCGKSHTVDNICQDDTKKIRVVFHPEYTYTDFVGQIMPFIEKTNVADEQKEKISYKFKQGPFTKILKDAWNDENGEMYYLLIEELNRGNAPAIFGELFQLLDRIEITDVESGTTIIDENQGVIIGASKYAVYNAELANEIFGDKDRGIRIPRNLTIVATMNTSDQNVFTLDTAFQRRWFMKYIPNNFNGENEKQAAELIKGDIINWGAFATTINTILQNPNNGYTSTEDKSLGVYFAKGKDFEKDNFAQKVLKYLWDDAFKFDRASVFDDNIKSFGELIENFTRTQENCLKSVLKVSVYEEMLKKSNVSESTSIEKI